jgi:hypothetical protein
MTELFVRASREIEMACRAIGRLDTTLFKTLLVLQDHGSKRHPNYDTDDQNYAVVVTHDLDDGSRKNIQAAAPDWIHSRPHK